MGETLGITDRSALLRVLMLLQADVDNFAAIFHITLLRFDSEAVIC